MKTSLLTAYHITKAVLEFKPEDLKNREKIVFVLIMGLIEKNGQVTVHEVKQANKGINEGTTASIFKALRDKGYFTSQRSGQYFSRAYITPTEKGLLTLRSFRILVRSLRH